MKAVPPLPRSPRNIRKRVPQSPRAPATSAATPCAADEGSLAARFAAAIDQLDSPLSAPFALAVSGGSDSVALMHLSAEWMRARESSLRHGTVLTVDHGLRPGSTRDSEVAAEWARRLGFAAHVLHWRGGRPRSNIEDAARRARYRLLGDWCREHGVATLLLAHTRDDQAETFLLRLGRGSGVDGLSAMRGRAPVPLEGYEGIALVRPLLDIGRNELRRYLTKRGVDWLDDPMNQDARFARVRIRQIIPMLEAAGINTVRIAQAAKHLSRAREALERETQRFTAQHVRFTEDGRGLIDGDALRAQPHEIGLRVLSSVLMRVSGRTYRPRFDRLMHLFDVIFRGAAAHTLSGCRIGGAPKGFLAFGPATLEIRQEQPRKRHRPDEDAAEQGPGQGTPVDAVKNKLRKNRRNIERLSRS